MTAAVTIVDGQPSDEVLLAIYADAGWTAYTDEPATLLEAWRGSRWRRTALLDGVPVGVARSVGDGHTVAHLQDVLVLASHRRAGVGRALVEAWLADHAAVRQLLLLTDDDPSQHAFYTACGLTPVGTHGLVTYARLP